jgi:hypothetical protein
VGTSSGMEAILPSNRQGLPWQRRTRSVAVEVGSVQEYVRRFVIVR